jgi:co-chaperonin GroES (HSP10)
MEGVGHVIRTGPGHTITKGKRYGEVIPPPVKPGDRVAFRRFLKDAIPLQKVGETEYCLIAAGDLMATLPEGVEIGVFSERRPEE